MATYTVVLVVPNELDEDYLIEQLERLGVVAFCAPGSLVQDIPDEMDAAKTPELRDEVRVPIEFDGRRVEVQVLRRTEETGPLLRLVGINCQLDGDGPGDYYLSAPD